MNENTNQHDSSPIQSWSDWFDRAAEVFDDPRMKIAYYRDANTGEPYSYESMEKTYKDLWEKLMPSSADTILDVGCGVGFFTKHYAKKVKGIIGTDVASHMITSARQSNPGETFFVSPANTQPFEAETFNRLLCYGVTQYLPELNSVRKILDEFVRVLKPGGRILIGDILEPAKKTPAQSYKKQSPRGSGWWPKSLSHNLTKLYVPKAFFVEYCQWHGLRYAFSDQEIPGRFIPTPRYDVVIDVPSIRISPFSPKRWDELRQTKNKDKASSPSKDPSFWLTGAKEHHFFLNGRTALLACLQHLSLTKDDEVLIITTTNGPYISGCVTKTIEKVCAWKRKLTSRTKLALVIHEFGFPCPPERIRALKEKNIPILEDCAYAFGSRVEGVNDIGTCGDFTLYSLPKYLPSSYGGILVSKQKLNPSAVAMALSNDQKEILCAAIDATQPNYSKWNLTRRQNWEFFAGKLKDAGFSPYFDLKEKIVPGVFLTKVPEKFAGEETKQRLNTSGVESTQYYHQGGFYFPVHPFLTDKDKEHILTLFLQKA